MQQFGQCLCGGSSRRRERERERETLGHGRSMNFPESLNPERRKGGGFEQGFLFKHFVSAVSMVLMVSLKYWNFSVLHIKLNGGCFENLPRSGTPGPEKNRSNRSKMLTMLEMLKMTFWEVGALNAFLGLKLLKLGFGFSGRSKCSKLKN